MWGWGGGVKLDQVFSSPQTFVLVTRFGLQGETGCSGQAGCFVGGCVQDWSAHISHIRF